MSKDTKNDAPVTETGETAAKKNKMKPLSGKTLRLTESALMVALSAILSLFAVIQFPFGGSVTLFSQVPIVIISYRYGCKWGMFSGLALALIELLTGLGNFSYVTGIGAYLIVALADYIIPFSMLGLGGIFRKAIKSQVGALAAGSALVSLIRFLCHFVSGVTVWSGYAPSSTWQAIAKYAFVYNGSYMLPEMLITILGACLIGKFTDLSKEKIFSK